VVKVCLPSHLPFDTGIKMRYTTALYREGSPMNFIVFVCCWYAVAFGILLLQAWLNHRRSQPRARPQEPRMGLKEGETIIGVADGPDTIQFYIRDVVDDVVDEKRYD
jgi:hypothetical protein